MQAPRRASHNLRVMSEAADITGGRERERGRGMRKKIESQARQLIKRFFQASAKKYFNRILLMFRGQIFSLPPPPPPLPKPVYTIM